MWLEDWWNRIPYSGKYWRGIKIGILAVFRKSTKLKPANISGYYIHTQYSTMSIRTSTLQLITHVDCGRWRDGAVEVLLRKGTVLKCDALSRKKTEHVNKCVKQALVPGERAKFGMKRSAIHGSYTGYTYEERAKIGRYAAENGPGRATGHFVVPETIARRLKYEYLQRIRRQCSILRTQPSWWKSLPMKSFHLGSRQPFCDVISPGIEIHQI